jgi:flavin-dependent dehydrogenase
VARFDVAIVGGGPAGSSLAWLLARAGARIVLLDDGRHRPSAPRETLLAAAEPGLERAGLWQFAAAAAVPDPFRHGAIWGSDELVWREPGANGLLLHRGTFDEALRVAANSVGVERCDAVRVRSVAEGGHGVVFEDAQGRQCVVECERVVLATGRRARADLVPLSERVAGPDTAALTLAGTCPEASHQAVVEAVPQGWWWWIGDGESGGAATLLCCVHELAVVGTRALLAAARAAALGPVAKLSAARLVHGARATARVMETSAEVLLCGDAAATIDPLASQGVEKALAAADHAATVLLTAREHPEWWAALRAQHARWERGLFAAHAQTSQAFLARERRFVDAPFWRRRLVPPSSPPALPRDRLQVAATVQESEVFMRARDRFAAVEGARNTASGDAMSHIGYVPVVPVLRAFSQPRTLAEATAAAGNDARLFVLPPQVVHAAAVVLYQQGWLVSATSAAANH